MRCVHISTSWKGFQDSSHYIVQAVASSPTAASNLCGITLSNYVAKVSTRKGLFE